MFDDLINILTNFLGQSRRHSESKGQISFDCPVCGDDGVGKGNLEVNYIKGVYKCWSCGQINDTHGRIQYLIKTYGSREDLTAFKLIEKDLKFDLEYKSISSESIITLPKEFQSLLTKSSSDEYQMAIAYLNDRKIDKSIIEKFNLGYCTSGKYSGRIIIPSYDEFNKINFFSSRTYKKWIKPKYLNPDTDKTSIIFNEGKVNWDATVYLIEGPFDHLVVPNSTPLLGKYLDYDYLMFEKIFEKASGLVVTVLDGDALKDSKKLFFLLNNSKLRGRVRSVLSIPDKYDISKIYELLGNKGVLKTLRTAKIIPDHQEIY